MPREFDPDGASIYQSPSGWVAEDQYDWFVGPYGTATRAAWELYKAVKDWEANYEPSEADLRTERMSAKSDGEVRHGMEQAKRLK